MYRSALSANTSRATNLAPLKFIRPDPCPIRAQTHELRLRKSTTRAPRTATPTGPDRTSPRPGCLRHNHRADRHDRIPSGILTTVQHPSWHHRLTIIRARAIELKDGLSRRCGRYPLRRAWHTARRTPTWGMRYAEEPSDAPSDLGACRRRSWSSRSSATAMAARAVDVWPATAARIAARVCANTLAGIDSSTQSCKIVVASETPLAPGRNGTGPKLDGFC